MRQLRHSAGETRPPEQLHKENELRKTNGNGRGETRIRIRIRIRIRMGFEFRVFHGFWGILGGCYVYIYIYIFFLGVSGIGYVSDTGVEAGRGRGRGGVSTFRYHILSLPSLVW